MGRALLAAHSTVQKVSYVLPNKHYIGVDMGYIGVANEGEVFMPVAAPR
jgi:urate oxidase